MARFREVQLLDSDTCETTGSVTIDVDKLYQVYPWDGAVPGSILFFTIDPDADGILVAEDYTEFSAWLIGGPIGAPPK